MCTYTELIQRETTEKNQLTYYANMKKAGLDDSTICSIFGFSMYKVRHYKKLLSSTSNLEPKTV